MSLHHSDDAWMQIALEQAQLAREQDEVPVGAIVVHDNQIIGRGYNRPIQSCDPSAHAEIVAIRDAGSAFMNYRLLESTLYVTLEPCIMCAGAIIQARIARVVFGASDPKAGAVHSVFKVFDAPLNHKLEYQGGVCRERCASVLQDFFRAKRAKSAEA